DVAYLFKNYVAILAAIPAVCGFIGNVISGVPFVRALLGAIVGYLLAFVTVYIVALIVDFLAPTFNAQKSMDNALKLTTYSYSASWVGGIFLLIPSLRILAMLAGLYGLYLLWLGLPPLMKAPEDKSIVYAIAIVICAIVVMVVIGLIIGAIGLSLLL